jgi:hypothetical protein
MTTVQQSPAPPPKQVSRFEANLLRILRFFFRQVPGEEAIPLVRAHQSRPNCLSPAAVHLVKDTLSKGCVLYMVRTGGWKKDRFLRNGTPQGGRLWERSAVTELALDFSRHSLAFLIWLTSNKPGESRPMWSAPVAELTIGDNLLLFLAYQSLREEPDIAAALRESASFALHPLCQLFYPEDFSEVEQPPSFELWFSPRWSLVVEALQPILEARWLEIERGKGQISDWDKMRAQGLAELRVLSAFLDAVDRANRWDLAKFLLGVFGKLLAAPDMTPAFWTGGLQGSGPARLAERLQTQRSALSLLRQAQRLQQWEQRARTRGFMDEDYAAAKFWLGEWERHNSRQTTASAAAIVQLLEPLRTG